VSDVKKRFIPRGGREEENETQSVTLARRSKENMGGLTSDRGVRFQAQEEKPGKGKDSYFISGEERW